MSAAFVAYLSAKTGGFKINNVNILKAIIQAAALVAQHVGDGKFSKPAAWELIKNFGDRFSDKKTKELVDSLLSALSEAISAGIVWAIDKFVLSVDL